MASIFFYIVIFYLVTNLFGMLLERVKIPRIYAALFIGVLLSTTPQITTLADENFAVWLSRAGMFALLFLLGYGLNIKEIKKQGRLILKITFWVIFSEILIGTLILHFLFSVGWILSIIVASSFATVGEVALLPLLKEFDLIRTKLGQTIFGVAILDDVVEIIAFIAMITFVASFNTSEILTESIPLLAILTGVVAGNISAGKKAEKTMNFLALFALGPFFFFKAGVEANLNIFVSQFFLILGITLAIKATKITAAYFTSHKTLGTKKAIVLGVSLCIKFSTSIVILTILLQKNLISQELFSVLIGVKVLFKFIVPLVLSYLLTHWHMELKDAPEEIKTAVS